MKLVKLNNIKCNLPNSKGGYSFPKYKITGSSDFLFTLLFGIKNSGKTVAGLNYLIHEKHLMENQNKVYFFSPTLDQKLINFQKDHPDNFIIIDEFNVKTFQAVVKAIKETVETWKQNKMLLEIFDMYIHKKKLDPDMIDLLQEHNFLQDFDFENFNYNYPPIHTVMIDDSLGSPMISSRGKEAQIFNNFAIRHRHFFCNLFIMSQYPKGINKVIRSISNNILIWQMKDRTIYEAIFPEFSSLFKGNVDKFIEIMQKIEDMNNHSFLFIYYDKEQFIRLNFDNQIILD
jgi:predicted DNA-binding protein YlxM (UPF0122 family)